MTLQKKHILNITIGIALSLGATSALADTRTQQKQAKVHSHLAQDALPTATDKAQKGTANIDLLEAAQQAQEESEKQRLSPVSSARNQPECLQCHATGDKK